ncbi:hypothetical protein GCM10028803_17760 [Larkinella knui]|uniref:Uncharacterized protein n=1 Tax=Larkinella knui TaxID=2025310 RepID=A0A3P1CUR3_9BACT|nr:hypothetical protein [Larkinella knui]RRB16886.1 hypothetical protein EHT87_00930 [Larkinella knui]
MADFKNLNESIAYLEKIDFQTDSNVRPVSIDGLYRLLYLSNKELAVNNLFLYGLKIETIRVYILPDSGFLAGFHLFFYTDDSLLKSIEGDIGKYAIVAGWGLDDENASDFDIFSWNYRPYEIDLHKRKRFFSDDKPGPVQDIISGTTAAYKSLQQVYLNAIREQ